MFTGLVEQIGAIAAIERTGKGATLRVESTFQGLVLGESIAVGGACLTVTRFEGGTFDVDASLETLAKTTLGDRHRGDRVHLERALALGARVGGHLVSGHVDGVGTVLEKRALGDALHVVYEAPPVLAPLIAPKGSITVDGTSLTVNEVHGQRFGVVLVPYTRGATLLEGTPDGAHVNLEVDLLAKYVARLLGKPGVDGSGGGVTLDLLRSQGYA